MKMTVPVSKDWDEARELVCAVEVSICNEHETVILTFIPGSFSMGLYITTERPIEFLQELNQQFNLGIK